MPKVAIAGPEDLDRVRAVIERSRKTYANLAPLWNRVGAFIFRHGEHFYNFQGLRQYKEKFDPEWKSKYLASPGG